ncbi:Uncharacterised protein [Klebsiella pneumoniae]|uniref:hypothetical protein n=1 Tax=Klebsiella pneumoniae TaxID=573 RepID=UPI0007CBAD1A|nr:hypothetical protein [Klebsiella pneumoniae]WLY36979.1 hypothetical protein RA201_14535 [Klebsiella pneumoniae]SAT36713.1 Uncharacterised protein [Klebsiella pneumoniae]VVL18514.1 Uncharacterised protein [Klebsiella pneumoniae]HBQ1395183.1 hypothetical protein [Klebsiella pneumoniae]HBR5825815.1 hypothetical protein [Klebsiella pneumoniae]
MNIETVNELIQSLESAGELSIKETKVMALAKVYQQLAAENVVMIRLLTDISENHVEYYSEGEDGMFAGVPLDYVSEINMYVSRDVNAENPFTATDRIVAGIKADGVEMFALMFAEEAIKDNNITTGWKARASRAASEYAELLREGAGK